MTADGSILLGSRDSKVFLLDRRTGRSVQTLSNAAALEDHSSSLGKPHGGFPALAEASQTAVGCVVAFGLYI
jgi:hypothetical protein